MTRDQEVSGAYPAEEQNTNTPLLEVSPRMLPQIRRLIIRAIEGMLIGVLGG